ncbi:MAG: protein kinase family protein, partial [Candidatus Xenobia bacterium]
PMILLEEVGTDRKVVGCRVQPSSQATSANAASKVQCERDFLVTLNHPRLPQFDNLVIDAVSSNCWWFLFNRVVGPRLTEVSAPTATQVLGWTCEMLEALEYLHVQTPARVVSWLDPQRIVVGPHGIALLEIGLQAHLFPEAAMLSLGTRTLFVAPEQRHARLFNPPGDVYSAGVVAQWLLCGAPDGVREARHLPWRDAVASHPNAVNWLDLMTAIDPSRRPTAGVACDQLRVLLQSNPVIVNRDRPRDLH